MCILVSVILGLSADQYKAQQKQPFLIAETITQNNNVLNFSIFQTLCRVQAGWRSGERCHLH